LISKPSRRWYVSYKDLKPVAWGQGIGIISTSIEPFIASTILIAPIGIL
jgi:hypothetical protein